MAFVSTVWITSATASTVALVCSSSFAISTVLITISASSPADGVVTFAGNKPGYGLMLTIDHGYGISTAYGHNSRFFVAQGTKVKRGMPISSVGNSGRSTGPHLHYEVRINGVPVDPRKFILDNPWE